MLSLRTMEDRTICCITQLDVNAPYFEGAPGYTRRPALIDPIVWVDDWPVVRGGYFASADKQPAPAAQWWQYNAYEPRLKRTDEPCEKIAGLSDEFNSDKLSTQWHFIHPQGRQYIRSDRERIRGSNARSG